MDYKSILMLPLLFLSYLATPKIPLPSPEISDVGDNYIALKWNKVDVPAFDYDETPLSFMIEAQSVPDYNWKPVARGVTGASHRVGTITVVCVSIETSNRVGTITLVCVTIETSHRVGTITLVCVAIETSHRVSTITLVCVTISQAYTYVEIANENVARSVLLILGSCECTLFKLSLLLPQ